MKKVFYLLIALLLLGSAVVSVNAKGGYTYDHKGTAIHSTVGMSASTDGIYTITSNAWEGIPADQFTSPEDLFIFKHPVTGEETIYIIDSISNHLYVFDSTLTLKQGSDASRRTRRYRLKGETVDRFYEGEIITRYEFRPDTITRYEYDRVKSGTDTSNELFKNKVDWLTFIAPLQTPVESRGDSQRWYIQPKNISGVYRALRPLRDEGGFIIEGEYQDVLYICDKGNNQILLLDPVDYHVIQVVCQPESIVFEGKTFSPLKMVTDSTGRMFVISESVFEGIMQMSYFGEFMSYVGVNYTTLSAWDKFWRNFSTEEQLKQQTAIVNTEFRNLSIDDDGFIYTVSRATKISTYSEDATTMIKKINPSGKDTLVKNGYHLPVGDIAFTIEGSSASDGISISSRFAGIAINDYGVYTVADEKAGRLFTYDDEGNLLYISGNSGPELNNINSPTAVRYQGEDILVLDKYNKAVIRFEPTDIAKIINKAVKYQYNGQLAEAAEEWKNVVSENPNYELAYIGIGKSLLNENRYQDAMANFRLGFETSYYSNAYQRYRDREIKLNFTAFAVLAIGAALILVARSKIAELPRKDIIRIVGED